MFIELLKEIKISKESSKDLQEKFGCFLNQANEMHDQVMGIVITSEDQIEEMKQASLLRKALKKVRVSASKVKDDLKQETIAYNRAVDKVNNAISEKIKPLEEHLMNQEKFIENKIKKALEELEKKRFDQLKPYEEFVPFGIKIGELKTEEFERLLNGCKAQQNAKIEYEKRLETERIENERIEKRYNSRLSLISTLGAFFNNSLDVKNLIEEDFMLAIQKAAWEKKKHDEDQERIIRENEILKKEKEEKEQKRKKRVSIIGNHSTFFNHDLDLSSISEYEFFKELECAKEKYREYNEEQKAKALENERLRKEKEQADRIAREVQERKDKEIADLKAKEFARIKKEKEEKEAKEKEAKEKIIAKKAELMAPDKEKLISFAEKLLSLEFPKMKNETSIILIEEIKISIKKVVDYLNQKSKEL